MYYLPAQRTAVYRSFKSLETNDYVGIVRFYEEHEQAIRTLAFSERFDCTCRYARALFEMGDYHRHIALSDRLLETIIMENVEHWAGEDIYAEVLFRKAASHHHLFDDAAAEHVLRELLKINPRHLAARRLLQANLLRRRPRWRLRLRAVGLVVLLGAVLAVAADLFVVSPFFPPYAEVSRWLSNGL
ncbi:MAG TPA: hypothetical protein PK971_06650, partial [Saprospiraceae bacterium]|nr:hypothetical protein [Saprospiraceae bacterium]